MKVIIHGPKPAAWQLDVVCTGVGYGGGGCRALLRVEEAKDVHFHRVSVYNDNDDLNRREQWFVRCPDCAVQTRIAKPPKHIQEFAVVTDDA